MIFVFVFEEMVLRAVSFIRKEDSHDVLETLDSTRDILRDSFEEFKREQELYRTELEKIMKMKEAAIQRPKGKNFRSIRELSIDM